MAQTNKQTDGRGDSMTNSAQWGRVGENLENATLPRSLAFQMSVLDRFWTYIDNKTPCKNIIVVFLLFLDGENQTWQ